MKTKLRAKTTLKVVYFAAASASIVLMIAAVIGFHIVQPPAAMAASAGDFRSVANGNWAAAATWERFNGAIWVAAAAGPVTTDGVVTIQNGTTVTVAANVSADQVVIDAGGILSVNTGKTLTIAAGTGTDLQVDGTLTINGSLTNNASTTSTISGTVTLKNGGTHTIAGGATITINNGGYYDRQDNSLTTSAGIFTVNSGGTYAHNVNGANIIQATWNSGSLCLVNGITTTKPGNLNQSFYNFTWNCPSQSSMLQLAGKLLVVQGDLTWVSTGSSYCRWGDGENYTMDISGNYYHQGGTIVISAHSQNCRVNVAGDLDLSGGIISANDSTKDSGDGSPEVYITGNVNVTGGTINFSQYKNNGLTKGHMDWYLYSDWIQTGGTATVTSSGGGHGEIFFDKNGTQFFTKTGGTIDQEINFTVLNNSVTDLNTSILTGAGTFDLNTGGEIRIGDPNGITASAASGNVQVTGTRTFRTGGFYTYNGGVAQVTGDGLPTSAAKLTINNASGVALSRNTSISNTLYLTTGILTTPSDTIIIGTSTGTLGALNRTNGMVDGSVKRWFANATVNNVEFPLGKSGLYESMNFSYTVAPTAGGTITAYYTATNPGKNGFDILDAGDTLVNIGYGLWTSSTGNGLTGGTFSLDITATSLATVADFTKIHLIKRANAGSNWLASGTHAAGTGSNAIPIAHRTALTSHGQYGIASGSVNPLPITLMYFNAKQNGNKVDLSWATASELNNDYFTIERSEDGENFTDLLTKRGAGNSTVTRVYTDVDPNPLKGVNYYRLKQTDYNGNFSRSEIKSVNFSEITDTDINMLSIYPNPFKGGFKISFNSAKDGEATFMVLNVSGSIVAEKKIQAQSGNNSFEYLEESELPPGIYFAYLIVGETKLSQKIIKQ